MSPHLRYGRKYDMRYFVLVSNFDPLVIFVYEYGTVKVAPNDYDLSDLNPHFHYPYHKTSEQLGLSTTPDIYLQMGAEGHNITKFKEEVYDLHTKHLIMYYDRYRDTR